MNKITEFDKNMYNHLNDFKNKDSNEFIGITTGDTKVRPKYEDGEPAHTVYKTNVYETYSNPTTEMISTLRPLAWKSAIKEILWIYQDQSNSLDLLEAKYNIMWWRPWDVGDGTIGQRYGATVKRYNLINNLLDGLKNDPYSRRHIMTLYQYQDFTETEGLHPCAMETIWNVINGKLDLMLIQRSSDYLVANAINKIQYLALQMMVAKHVGLEVGKFTHVVGNLHVYDRHTDHIENLIKRYDKAINHNDDGIEAKLVLDTDKTDFYDFTINDFKMVNYEPINPQLSFELGI